MFIIYLNFYTGCLEFMNTRFFTPLFGIIPLDIDSFLFLSLTNKPTLTMVPL
jgi:hypothetical protein